MPIKHTFESEKEDGEDATLVRPSNWNANHTLELPIEITGNFVLDADGILTLAKQSSCRIESDVEQAVANATWTVVQFNSDAYDIQDESDLANNRITIKASGTYLVLSGASIYSVPDGTEVIIEIQLDGNAIGDGRILASKATNLIATGAAITYAAAGSHFTARVRQDSGSSKNLSQYPSQNFLAIFKLG